MNSSSPSDSIDENLRKEFERRWLRKNPGEIEKFLPPEDDYRYLGTLEELVHIEIEMAWKQWMHDVEHDINSDGGAIDQPAPIESYIGRFPDLNNPDIRVRLLKQECLVRKQVGIPLSEEMCRARFPDIDLEAVDLLPYVERSIPDESSTPGATLALDDPGNETITLPLHFADYELLEEIGRGSMGIVYRAKQISRPRIVAVKILRSKLLDNSSVAAIHRFQQEIKTVTKLRHENIVCVFDVNENKGHHFFSMQYVRGQSLAEITSRRPIDNRTAAQYLEQVARAIHYAHRGGILHRDLKPANILIDDDTNRPLVVDFGLAKISEREQSITAIGETLGTPSFMSPEQVQNASHATEQSDIYSIGATLYTLLSGKPPFSAARSSETLRQVSEEYPTPLRQLNTDVDKDLETICMKCLQKAPTARYASAEDLADDLHRYLKGEKILARPSGQYADCFRYMRHNKSAFIPLCFITCLLVVGSFILLYHFLIASNPDRHLTNRMTRAEKVVVDSVDNLVDEYSINTSPQSAMEQELLREFYKYYATLLADSQNSKSTSKFDSTILLQMARIQTALGNLTDATRLLHTVIQRSQDIVPAEGNQEISITNSPDPHTANILARAWFLLGMIEERIGNIDHAMRDFGRSSAYLKYLADHSENHIEDQLLTAHCNVKLGALALYYKRWSLARKYLETATKTYQQVLQENPDNTFSLVGLADCYFHIGQWERLQGNQRGYQTYLEASVRELEHLIDTPQYVPSLKTLQPLVISCRDLGNLHARMTDPKKAISWYKRAFAFSQQIGPIDLTNSYQAIEADVLMQWAESLNTTGRTKEALDKYQISLKIWRSINKQNPSNPEFVCQQAIATGQLAQTQKTLGFATEARHNLSIAKKMLSQLLREHPGKAQFSGALERILHLQQRLENQDQSGL